MPGQITHSEAGDRGVFALEQGGRQVAEMTYQRIGEARILVDHTHVDPALRGHGVARQLLDAAVAWARQTHSSPAAMWSCSSR
jgi:hypothetical protein